MAMAVESAHRAQAAAVERRRAAQESSEQFERSFGYVCTCRGACTHWQYQFHMTPGHELRNPLHGVSAAIEACLSGRLTLEALREELVVCGGRVT